MVGGRGGGAGPETENPRDVSPPDSPFFGFSNADIPRPIEIKTEPVEEDNGDEDCRIVSVCRASKPLPQALIKKEREDEDDIDIFHGFTLTDLPRPIVIKEEALEDDEEVTASRAAEPAPVDCWPREALPLGPVPATGVPGDELIDEFAEPEVAEPTAVVEQVATPPNLPAAAVLSPEKEKVVGVSPQRPVQRVVFSAGQEVQVSAQQQPAVSSNSIQIIDQNGQKIVILNSGEGELGSLPTDESDLDTDNEDREFTVIVEEEEDEELEGDSRDIHIDENNVIEAESIEDILAQFESESAPRSVACPNCRKCFVSAHFLNLHISNSSTMCDLCNTQCCSQVNLRNHKNLECDLSKRKRNIDLIAQETAILGRKPIEPEKYYNLPIESDEETGDDDMSPGNGSTISWNLIMMVKIITIERRPEPL
jgi:hypothetical protein